MYKKYYIVDIDGTLYFHTPVRFMMILEMLTYILCHPTKYKELILIHKYRQYHKSGSTIDHNFFAKKNNININYANKIINKWMIQKPLKWIKLFADKKLISILQTKKIIFFSDYPTEEKLKALKIKGLGQYYCDNINIINHKPSPEGLEYIMKKHNLKKQNMIVIGDRHSHDGQSAKNFGCNYFILNKYQIFRMSQYKDIP
jgi:HAD superfamily hydrolase (TIGR01549 family)